VFGASLALSGDGTTLAIGSQLEDSYSRGVGGDQNEDSAADSGAVYYFTCVGETWSQQDYVKATNADAYDEFGSSLSLNRDGSLMAIGAHFEDGAAAQESNQEGNSAFDTGAVYLFSR